MAIDCIFYVRPNTITDLTIWKNGVQVSPESSGIDGEYLWFEYFGSGGAAVLKATGYEDLEINLYEGPPTYYTMVSLSQNSISTILRNGVYYLPNGKVVKINN